MVEGNSQTEVMVEHVIMWPMKGVVPLCMLKKGSQLLRIIYTIRNCRGVGGEYERASLLVAILYPPGFILKVTMYTPKQNKWHLKLVLQSTGSFSTQLSSIVPWGISSYL